MNFDAHDFFRSFFISMTSIAVFVVLFGIVENFRKNRRNNNE